jgi:4-amino-4-deoxy-L-arabinose transferase-like glycosyltransferase
MTASGFRRALIGIALGGLALRLIYAYAIVKSRPLLGDALEFQQQANLLADGHGYIQLWAWGHSHVALPTADKPPVYPFLEAIISVLGGRSWAWHDLIGVLSGTGTVVVVGLIGRRVSGPRVGVIAATLAAFYPLLIASDGSLRSESVYVLLIVLTLLAALRLRESRTIGRAAILGALIALAALTRGEALLLLVLLPFSLAGARRGAVSVVACLLVLSPWLVRCWIAFGQPVLISTNVGSLVAGANCDQTYSGSLIGQWSFSCLFGKSNISCPPGRSILSCIGPPHYRNEAKEASSLLDTGLRYARDHAGRLPLVIAARLGRSFELYHPEQQAYMEYSLEGRSLSVEEAGRFVYYLVALLAIWGAVLLHRRRGPWAVLLAPMVLVIFVSVTGYGFTRFRVAGEPGLIVLAAVSVDALVGRVRRGVGADKETGRSGSAGSSLESRVA